MSCAKPVFMGYDILDKRNSSFASTEPVHFRAEQTLSRSFVFVAGIQIYPNARGYNRSYCQFCFVLHLVL